MNKNEVSIRLIPEVIVIVDDRYEVTQVPLPSDLPDENVKWLCNFKITENRRKPEGKFTYQIQVYPIRRGKTLVFLNDSGGIEEVENQEIITKNKKSYMQGDLHLADPPIGWV
jgi:hypothetical protein